MHMRSQPSKSRSARRFPTSLYTPIKTIIAASTIALAATANPASATWSILITDTRTGEIVLGSATCVPSIDLAISTPVLITGVGAVTAQSAVDISGQNRMFIRDRLLENQPLSHILSQLELNDPGHSNRQYGMIKANGDVLTYSGIENADWAGGTTGRIEQGRPGPKDDIVYTVQGNILSGPNVVDAAISAIHDTDSDLPGKLMAAMLAARVAGGDGRCSCSNANPTGCGSPPPAPFKSADVGYMIGARADDTDSVRAFYNLPANSTSLTQLDNNTFAIADIDENIHLYDNATNTNNEVAHFVFNQTIETTLPSINKIIAADLDNNGLNDLVVQTGARTIAVIFQSESNVFTAPLPLPQQPTPTIRNIEPLISPGIQDQILVSAGPSGYLRVFKFNGTDFEITYDNYDESRHVDAELVDINNDQLPDLLDLDNLNSSPNVVVYLGSDSEVFGAETFLPGTSADPVKIRTADINNDNLLDILVATASTRSLDVFINTGTPNNPTFAPRISSPLSSGAIDFQITDLNADNIQDAIVLLESGANLRYYLGDNAGNFTETNRTRIGGTPTDALLFDLNSDGDMDLITNASDQLLIYDNLNNATVQRQTGFVRGDKFMFINIPNQGSAAEDAVDQMIPKFQDFRDSLADVPDAVQTTVTQPSRILIDDAGPTPKLRVHIKDYEQQTLQLPATFSLEFNPKNLTPGLPEFVAPGIYDIPLSALSENGAKAGNHPLTIRVTANERTVTLMPSLTISTTTNLADFNADDALNFIDISIFINALSSQNPVADLNDDGFYNIEDLNIFLSAYKAAP